MASGEDLTFPFLTAECFDNACQAFLKRIDVAGGARELGWLAVEYLTSKSDQTDHPILRISKCTNQNGNLMSAETPQSLEQIQEDLIEDDDQETFIRNGVDEQHSTLDYDIILSTSYHVPVMYFTFRDAPQVGPALLDDIYKLLVPRQHQRSLRSNGVMGGISFGYHPQSGIPAYFVHPCNTATAMKAIIDGDSIEPEDYLLVWLGLIGGCINLSLPSKLFTGS